MAAADEGVVLVEPARAQVIGLAADILGRLPADEVPSALRAIARFAPAKRQRLGGVALAAALDSDESFREKVADAIAKASPELTAAVREGTSTAAADPIDVAVIAYLTRPQGWRDVLTAANSRWTAERGVTAARTGEVERLRGELAELRTQVRGEPARVREALAAAGAAAEAELVALRRSLRDRTRELRAAERDRDAARESEAELRNRVDALAGAHDAELRRHRARHAEAERAAEAARRDLRTERDIDDARLWLLIDTLVQAATGVRRELSLSPPAVRPADTVESAGETTGRRAADDPAALDRLLALPNVHLVIDGYNVTKTGYGELSLAEQRTRLVGALAPLVAQSGAEVTVAFDGGAKPPVQPPTPRGVRVLFSAGDEIADDLIRRLVAAEPTGRPVVVVTSDRQVILDTARDGAWSVPSAVLLARLG
ncbi:MAG: NYN domain-containing protein [Jatrophihabitans sp.]|uniref:NYN domain-containing protein n=1 Tax=Jatrophihabitans sp. TaxID=1932789 RepID=UPI00390E2B75